MLDHSTEKEGRKQKAEGRWAGGQMGRSADGQISRWEGRQVDKAEARTIPLAPGGVSSWLLRDALRARRTCPRSLMPPAHLPISLSAHLLICPSADLPICPPATRLFSLPMEISARRFCINSGGELPGVKTIFGTFRRRDRNLEGGSSLIRCPARMNLARICNSGPRELCVEAVRVMAQVTGVAQPVLP